jgi:hypothetical protein
MAAKKTVHEIDAERAKLALEWAEISARIQPDLDRIAAIRTELEQLPVLKYSIPGVDLKVDVSQGRSFKPALFMARYPVTARPDLYKAVPDQDRIKAELPPAEVEKFTAPNKPSVKLV